MNDPRREDRISWWNSRRPAFSAAVAIGYAAAILLHETVAPSWTGDHIGLYPGAVFIYGVTGLMWIAGANVVFTLWPLFERIRKPADLCVFRSRAWRLGVGLGAASFPLWYVVSVYLLWVSQR